MFSAPVPWERRIAGHARMSTASSQSKLILPIAWGVDAERAQLPEVDIALVAVGLHPHPSDERITVGLPADGGEGGGLHARRPSFDPQFRADSPKGACERTEREFGFDTFLACGPPRRLSPPRRGQNCRSPRNGRRRRREPVRTAPQLLSTCQFCRQRLRCILSTAAPRRCPASSRRSGTTPRSSSTSSRPPASGRRRNICRREETGSRRTQERLSRLSPPASTATLDRESPLPAPVPAA